MIWLVVSLLAEVALVAICVIYSYLSSDPTRQLSGTLQPSMTGSAAPSPETASASPESTPPMPPSLAVEALMFRIRALENLNRQKDLAIRTMSDVRHVPMLAQFNNLEAEYTKLWSRFSTSRGDIEVLNMQKRELLDKVGRLELEIREFNHASARRYSEAYPNG